jgi:hypothetical protein
MQHCIVNDNIFINVPPRYKVGLERRYDISHNMLEPILHNLGQNFIANHIKKRYWPELGLSTFGMRKTEEEGEDKIWCEKHIIKLIRL